jgi:hypothetical protein
LRHAGNSNTLLRELKYPARELSPTAADQHRTRKRTHASAPLTSEKNMNPTDKRDLNPKLGPL